MVVAFSPLFFFFFLRTLTGACVAHVWRESMSHAHILAFSRLYNCYQLNGLLLLLFHLRRLAYTPQVFLCCPCAGVAA